MCRNGATIYCSSLAIPRPAPQPRDDDRGHQWAISELVDVSQRGRTSPSVSITAARQVRLSDPYGELPSWIRGDAPLPLWPLETSGGEQQDLAAFQRSKLAEYNIQKQIKSHKVKRGVAACQRRSQSPWCISNSKHILYNSWKFLYCHKS